MDFRQITQPVSGRPNPTPQTSHIPEPKGGRDSRVGKEDRRNWNWMQIFSGVMLVSIGLLVASVALMTIQASTNRPNESQYVDTNKYQAVFLNNGQVYFGKITALNSQYVRLTNIYYLTQNGSTSTNTSSSNYSLIKLGCQQIHDPYDAMVINHSQVTFWENLQNKGKVVSSIQKFQQQNPNGPNCSQVSSQTQASSSATQGATTGTTNANPQTKK